MNVRREAALVMIALGAFVALSVRSLRTKSATFDEGTHLPAGYTYLALGDYRLNPEHPPLVKMMAALPLRLLPVEIREYNATWPARRQWEFGRRFLYHWNDADRLLFYGRLPIVGLAVLLGLAVFLCGRSLYGPRAALLALGLCVLSPDVLAHGQLVTTDVGISLFSFLAVSALFAMRQGVTVGRTAALAASFAAAAATKYSALLLVPTLGALAAVLAWKASRPRAARALAVAAAMLLGTLLLLWACYGFRYAASSDPAAQFDWTRVETGGPVVRAVLLARDHRLLPEAFVYGFLRFYKAAEARPAFLMGEVSDEGWWYYFPVTFALKTPLPLIALLAAAAWSSLRRRQDLVRECFLWMPPALYMTLVMTRSLNIGHRHLLPVYPYLFILGARSAAAGLAHAHRGVRAVTIVLLAWYAGGTLRQHPHYLSYFNELAGGPRNAYRWLVDSNLDWGQDLKGLKAWMDAHGVSEIKLSYFGTADPDYYGIRGERLPGYLRPPRLAAGVRKGDWVAISATNLQGVYVRGDAAPLMARFRTEAPVDHVGHSILIYRAGFDYPLPQDPLY